ncbi:unnamed protein product [Owenia fusiformis]|uniref:Lipocalin/cytosolic fatty-acid binding domain-containing protein n=1 Tax=Owenia fusiformis TaxID=6347 RepID=A0A8J1YCP3_OWEFU|nr:unnamed protein product [Owenia fusiformis]
MADGLQGNWSQKSVENLENYMKAVGVGFALRKIGNVTSTHEELVKDGDSWTINVTSTFKNSSRVAKLEEEFDEVTADGRKCKSTFSNKDGKLVKHQKGPGESIITRELVDDNTMILTMVPVGKEEHTSTRTYTRDK